MSPDLNPIKHLWGELKSDIGERNPANVQDLGHTAKEVWEELPSKKRKKLIEETLGGCHCCQRVFNQILRKGANISEHNGFQIYPLEIKYLC